MMNFQEYLEKNLTKGIIAHTLRACEGPLGCPRFYIHPEGKDGDTLDYEVSGDLLYALPFTKEMYNLVKKYRLPLDTVVKPVV